MGPSDPRGQGIIGERNQKTVAEPLAGNVRRGRSRQEAGSGATFRQVG